MPNYNGQGYVARVFLKKVVIVSPKIYIVSQTGTALPDSGTANSTSLPLYEDTTNAQAARSREARVTDPSNCLN